MGDLIAQKEPFAGRTPSRSALERPATMDSPERGRNYSRRVPEPIRQVESVNHCRRIFDGINYGLRGGSFCVEKNFNLPMPGPSSIVQGQR